MKPVGKNVLVKVDLDQRRDYEIQFESGSSLWMNSEFGTDQKMVASTKAVVVNPGIHSDLTAGDVILCRHNTFNAVVNQEGDLLGSTGVVEKEFVNGHLRRFTVFSISKGQIHAKVGHSGHLIPLDGWLTVEPVDITPKSDVIQILETSKKLSTNRYKVISVGPDCDFLKSGDEIVTYEKSGVELHYVHNMKRMHGWRCRVTDVLGIVEPETKRINNTDVSDGMGEYLTAHAIKEGCIKSGDPAVDNLIADQVIKKANQ